MVRLWEGWGLDGGELYSVGRSPSMPLQGDFADTPAHKRRVGAYWLTV